MMEDKTQPLSDQVFHQFLGLLRYSRQHSRQFIDKQGIKPRQFSVLRYLLDHGPATVGQVQTFIHKSPSTTSALISELEQMGFVSRKRSNEDNRVVIVELSPYGREKADTTPLDGLPLLRRRLGRLPEKRLDNISDVLSELSHLMQN